MGKVEGTKVWEYRVYGMVPPGTDDATITQAIVNAVGWSGAVLSLIRNQSVVVHDIAPDEMARLVQGKIHRV